MGNFIMILGSIVLLFLIIIAISAILHYGYVGFIKVVNCLADKETSLILIGLSKVMYFIIGIFVGLILYHFYGHR